MPKAKEERERGRKSDRASGALLVRGLHPEPGARRAVVLPPLREALARLATWLELGRVDARVLAR